MNRKRTLTVLICVMVAAYGFAGATAESSHAPDQTGDTAARANVANIGRSLRIEQTETGPFLVDALGNRIPYRAFERMVVIAPGAVETLFLLGAGDRIIATVESRDPIHPAELTARLPTVGSVVRVSMEHILMHNPDLVIVDPMNPEVATRLAERGIRSIVYHPVSVEDIVQHVEHLGVLGGAEERANEVAGSARHRIAAHQNAADRSSPLRGLFLYTAAPMQAFSSDSLAGDILRTLGVENLADSLTGARPIVSPEFLLTNDPDFIWGAMSIRSVDDIIAADRVIARTRAGREGNIAIIPASMIMRASPLLFEQFERLAEKLPSPREG